MFSSFLRDLYCEERLGPFLTPRERDLLYHPFLFDVGEEWEIQKIQFAVCSDIFWDPKENEDIIIARKIKQKNKNVSARGS